MRRRYDVVMTEQELQLSTDQTQAFIAGDSAAFQYICDLYGLQLIVFLRNRCRDAQIADDIAQDVWLKAWKARSSFTNTSFRAWIFQIARNTLIDHQRRTSRRKETDGIENADFATEPGEFPQQREAELQALHDCLNEVGSDFVQALRMRLIEEKSTSEIAAEIGQTAGTVYSRIDRGKKQLKPCIEGKLA